MNGRGHRAERWPHIIQLLIPVALGIVVVVLAFWQTPLVGQEGAAEPAGAAAPAGEAPAALEVPAETPIGAQAPPSARDPRWAAPIEEPGLPNLHKVSDTLYRGAQPSAEGFRRLHEMGIETVVNLRSFHSDRDEMGHLALGYEHITMKAWHP
ncbi:MAG: protein-tyrosine phosphatase family protein, partial [Planctomycetota bacterium]